MTYTYMKWQGGNNLKRVLMIAYHYPPQHGSSGLQRTLSFGNYLPEFGWSPIILTVHPRAYPQINQAQLQDISPDIPVYRAFALDTKRHLGIRGRYSRLMALPDPFVSWWFGAVPTALYLIRKYRPTIVWTTYPIATAHLIGITVQKLTGIPWIADFRDSMTEENYPKDRLQKRVYQWIERHTVQRCTKAVFTTPGTLKMYADRYPDQDRQKWAQISNGYDENLFGNFDAGLSAQVEQKKPEDPLYLVHSGLLYPEERDPRAFFAAVSELKKEGKIDSHNLKIALRATGHDVLYRPILTGLAIEDIVFLEPSIGYRQAFEEMMTANGLIIFQASNCNHQIPAKAYEYLRAAKPVLAFTDRQGDTAKLLNEWGIAMIAPLDEKSQIKNSILKFIEKLSSGLKTSVPDSVITANTRRSRSGELSELLDRCRVPKNQ